jgi:hypothetical protein
MPFIRKRFSSNRRYGETYSYQVIETYRVAGQVKQRVLANLGRFATIVEALSHARENLLRWNTAPAPTGWSARYRRVLRQRLEDQLRERAERIAQLEARISLLAHLESVVSKMSLRTNILDTTGQRVSDARETP